MHRRKMLSGSVVRPAARRVRGLARQGDDPTPLDAIGVDSSCERLDYLAAYRNRCDAACSEFAEWDEDRDDDWTPEHEHMLVEELERKHQEERP